MPVLNFLKQLLCRPADAATAAPVKTPGPSPAGTAAPAKTGTGPRLPLTPAQKTVRLVEASAGHLADVMLPKLGPGPADRTVFVQFDIPATQNQARLTAQWGAGGEEDCRLQVQAFRRGTDLVISHYMAKGSREDLRTWLADPQNRTRLLESVYALSRSADEAN